MILKLVLVFCFIGIGQSQNLTLRIENGWILGSTMRSYSGREFYAYRSIPYGEPPNSFSRFQVKGQIVILMRY